MLARKRKATKYFVYHFIKLNNKLNNIFFLHMVNFMYVVLGWVCQIKTKFSEAKLRACLIVWFARSAWYLNFWALWKPNNRCGGDRMSLTCGKTSNFNNKPTSGNTNPCAIHTKWRKHYVHWESISTDLDKWPFLSLTFLASSMHHPASLYKERSIWMERYWNILSDWKANQEVTCRLTFDLLPQRAIRGFFLPYMFQIWSKKLKYSTLP